MSKTTAPALLASAFVLALALPTSGTALAGSASVVQPSVPLVADAVRHQIRDSLRTTAHDVNFSAFEGDGPDGDLIAEATDVQPVAAADVNYSAFEPNDPDFDLDN